MDDNELMPSHDFLWHDLTLGESVLSLMVQLGRAGRPVGFWIVPQPVGGGPGWPERGRESGQRSATADKVVQAATRQN